jgi:hypothetical protein
MTIQEWQDRLAANFTVRGLVGGHLTKVFDREREVGEDVVSTFSGQLALIDSFQSFFIETLDLALQFVELNGWPPSPSNYPVAFAHFRMLFRRYRACEILFEKGYPLDGYSLLRDIKDRAFLLAAVAHNMATFPTIMGSIPVTADKRDWKKKTTRARKDIENRISRRLAGKDSGLAPDVLEEIGHWDELFHEEVHGGRLSLSHELGYLGTGVVMPVGPTFHEQAFAVYMNRSSELGWIILRLLPYLQLRRTAFGDEWHRKHAVLDDSFRYMAQGLSRIGKKIGDAFVTLVDQKFSFAPSFCYFEADGSA